MNPPDFRAKLEQLINCQNMEAGSDTPDFILAQYLADCLAAFDRAVSARATWWGHTKVEVVTGDAPA